MAWWSLECLLTHLMLIINLLTFYTNRLQLFISLPHNSDFEISFGRGLWKKLWKKEKMLETSFLSFSHNVFFTLSKREIIILATFNLSCANAFNLVMSSFVVWERVKWYWRLFRWQKLLIEQQSVQSKIRLVYIQAYLGLHFPQIDPCLLWQEKD